jgi:hypothetical protein
VDELRRLTGTTPYFDELDVPVELAGALETLRHRGVAAITSALEHLRTEELSERQRFKLLEVLLHVVHADEAVDEAECAYLQQTQGALGLAAQDVARHFPTRFALFMPASAHSFRTAQGYKIPDTLPDSSAFLGG